MRVHFRRLVVTAIIIVFSIILALYVYGKATHWNRGAKRTQGKLIFHRFEFPTARKWKKDAIFWDQNSGVKRDLRDAEASRKENLSQESGQKLTGWAGKIRDIGSKLKNMTNELSLGGDNPPLDDQELVEASLKTYNLNVHQSDRIPLNRDVPDSRPKGCHNIVYPEKLPTISVVIPFHNEWPSVILRTVYSLINRTPKHLLKEIILVDDASDISILKTRLKNYIEWNFPKDLVKLIRLDNREGLIQARLEGLRYVTAETVSFFDSHMEVNKDWLQPLLAEIVKNKQTIAMGQLDYIHRETFDYNFYDGYRTRYGFRWDMQFFETYFRPDQLKGKKDTDPMPGVLMVGPGFVVDVQYFKHIGAYDKDMLIWGGENIELAWRVWMCGGQLLHVPCSHIGHVERSQPYSFPKGRHLTEMHNYKRAVEVWMGDYKKYVYDLFPGMKDLDVGPLAERNIIRARLKCRDFSWFIKNVWPELLPYAEDAQVWGLVKTAGTGMCLDNNDYVFQAPKPLVLKPCTSELLTQGFTITKDGRLRTTIHCVVAREEGQDLVPLIENCFLSPPQIWKYNENQQLVHNGYNMCLEVMRHQFLVLQPCSQDQEGQKWLFQSAGLLEDKV